MDMKYMKILLLKMFNTKTWTGDVLYYIENTEEGGF